MIQARDLRLSPTSTRRNHTQSNLEGEIVWDQDFGPHLSLQPHGSSVSSFLFTINLKLVESLCMEKLENFA